ncbi:hypothetical protein [Singulisphaera sp. PoT]|uniref:hypothetical protein n=1 Tax=Singulisphaera sp. PoT TaxID=3411797 RepID=UPI003BF48A76
MIGTISRIRSEPLGDRRLTPLLKALVKRLRQGAIICHEAMIIEAFSLLRDTLDDLEAFNELQSVDLTQAFGAERSDREPFLEAIRSHQRGRSRMFLTLYGTENEGSGPFDFRLSYGWQMEQTGENYPYCQFEVAGKSPGNSDLVYRRELLLRILKLIGLDRVIQVAWDGSDLFLSVDQGWQAIPILADLRGANPLGIGIQGFPNADAAVEAGERIVYQVLRRIDSADFSIYVEKREGYDAIRPSLRPIAGGWQVGVAGGLSEAAGGRARRLAFCECAEVGARLPLAREIGQRMVCALAYV